MARLLQRMSPPCKTGCKGDLSSACDLLSTQPGNLLVPRLLVLETTTRFEDEYFPFVFVLMLAFRYTGGKNEFPAIIKKGPKDIF